jgi:excisionase family DNA binding protein
MIEATKILGVTRQTILQRVKRGEIQSVHVCQGRRKRLRTKIVDNQPSLFDSASSKGV